MLAVPAVLCVCAAAWCSQALAAAAAVAAAGGRSDGGNFLDDKQWLTTISQYDKAVGQRNKFRDEREASVLGAVPKDTSNLVFR
nr:testican-3-like [Cavia porcellus]